MRRITLSPCKRTVFAKFDACFASLAGETLQLEFQLNVASIFETVTVTPARGQPQEVFQVPQSPVVVTEDEMARRYANILPQALRDVPGVHIQQTTSGQGSPFVRGLTGQQVLHLINGVRFNNSTFRPGANQYTALIDQDFADRVEVVRGPGSTQYGSDSLGGTINVLTRSPKGSDNFGIQGNVNTYFASADLSAGLSTTISGGSSNWGFVAQLLRAVAHRICEPAAVSIRIPSSLVCSASRRSFSATDCRTLLTVNTTRTRSFSTRLSDADVLSVEYLRGTQLGLRRYDQLDGGIGNLLNSFDPQVLDFFTARYDRPRRRSIRFDLDDLLLQRTARRSSLAEHQQRAGSSFANQRRV